MGWHAPCPAHGVQRSGRPDQNIPNVTAIYYRAADQGSSSEAAEAGSGTRQHLGVRAVNDWNCQPRDQWYHPVYQRLPFKATHEHGVIGCMIWNGHDNSITDDRALKTWGMNIQLSRILPMLHDYSSAILGAEGS